MRAICGGGVEDEDGLAVAGDGVGEGVPLVGGEVVGVFEAIGLAGQRREPRLCETSMAQWRQLHLHPGGGLVELAEAQGAGGIVRVGAAGALSGVEGARSSCASGMPSPSLSSSGANAEDFPLARMLVVHTIVAMKVADIKDVAERQPFRPFSVRLNNGAQYRMALS